MHNVEGCIGRPTQSFMQGGVGEYHVYRMGFRRRYAGPDDNPKGRIFVERLIDTAAREIGIEPITQRPEIDLRSLYDGNLISGVVSGSTDTSWCPDPMRASVLIRITQGAPLHGSRLSDDCRARPALRLARIVAGRGDAEPPRSHRRP